MKDIIGTPRENASITTIERDDPRAKSALSYDRRELRVAQGPIGHQKGSANWHKGNVRGMSSEFLRSELVRVRMFRFRSSIDFPLPVPIIACLILTEYMCYLCAYSASIVVFT